MIVGFTITDFKGHQKEAVEFIKKVCILGDAQIATNIVEAGVGVNIFCNVTAAELKAQPFSATPIETQDGRYIVASIVNFNLELLYNSRILRLVPTEFIFVDAKEVAQFTTYIHQGLVRTIPEFVSEDAVWILENAKWNDAGIWVDNKEWRD